MNNSIYVFIDHITVLSENVPLIVKQPKMSLRGQGQSVDSEKYTY